MFLFPEAKIKLVMSRSRTIDLDYSDYNSGPYKVFASDSAVDKFIATLKLGDVRFASLTFDWLASCMVLLQERRHRKIIWSEDDVRLISSNVTRLGA